MPDTVTVDPQLAKGLLDDVLNNDAGTAASSAPDAAPPPREPWLNEDGSPKYGLKEDGTPRKARPGTGRPRKGDDAPRTADKLPAAAAADGSRADTAEPAGGGRDYADDIGAALTMTWMGLATLPVTRAHAAVLRAQTPALVPVWNTAAQQNKTVRRYVEKLSGEGSWGWVIPVTLVTTQLGVSMLQVTRDQALRAQLAAQTEHDFGQFLAEQARAAGIELETGPAGEAGPEPDSEAA
jgi:hypothetical protein